MEADDAKLLVRRLTAQPTEGEWYEFKLNNKDPSEIGKLLSALSNSAALNDQHSGFILWGIDSQSHAVVGTTFNWITSRVNQQELKNYLATQLRPPTNFDFFDIEYEGKKVVILQVAAACQIPVRFKNDEYVRIGSYTKRLCDHPEKEKRLWHVLSQTSFEEGLSLRGIPTKELFETISYSHYVKLKELPDTIGERVLSHLIQDGLVIDDGQDLITITNLGAILLAKDLARFGHLQRKAVRLIIYRGKNRTNALREAPVRLGYAAGFEGLMRYLEAILPKGEQFGRAARRRDVAVYPEVAVRELIMNALIHQDFSIVGAGPMVEVFADRIEITNPGEPLIDTLRFIDGAPQSRNEKLASFMRRVGLCEERGSGVDKVVAFAELYRLPPPDFAVTEGQTRATLFAEREFRNWSKSDRIRACYQHTVLKQVSGETMTNASLRKRFGVPKSAYPVISRIIRDTLNCGLIRPYDPVSTSRKFAKYVPFWA